MERGLMRDSNLIWVIGIPVLLVFLLCVYAKATYGFGLMVCGGGQGTASTASAGCNPASDELGLLTVGAASITLPTTYAYGSLYTPDCSGDLYEGFVYRTTSGTSQVKVCVYLDDGDSNPDSGDTLVACSAAISPPGNNSWSAAGAFASGSVSTGSNYWVIVTAESAGTGWRLAYDDGVGSCVYGATTMYSTMDDPLPLTTELARQFSVYVTLN